MKALYGIAIKENRLWRDGRVIGKKESDLIAQKQGFECADQFISYRTGQAVALHGIILSWKERMQVKMLSDVAPRMLFIRAYDLELMRRFSDMMVYLSSASGCFHSLMADFQKEADTFKQQQIQMSTFLEELRRKERHIKRYKEKEAKG